MHSTLGAPLLGPLQHISTCVLLSQQTKEYMKRGSQAGGLVLLSELPPSSFVQYPILPHPALQVAQPVKHPKCPLPAFHCQMKPCLDTKGYSTYLLRLVDLLVRIVSGASTALTMTIKRSEVRPYRPRLEDITFFF